MSIAKAAGKAPRADPAHQAALEKSVDALTTLARLWRADAQHAAIVQTGLSLPMAAAVSCLGGLPDQITVSGLARSLACNMGNLSVTLDRLEEAGYVERVVCESDRRARFIRLTAKGRRMATQLNKLSGPVRAALRQMDVEQLEAMTEMISHLNNVVKTDAAS